MDLSHHAFSALFDQLGLPSDATSIQQFLTSHSPLKNEIKLVDAPFWSESQRAFLKAEYIADSDWIMTIDQLNVALRNKR